MSVEFKFSAIQGELSVSDEETLTSGSAEKEFSLDISTLDTGRFQLKLEGKSQGKISLMASGIDEGTDNINLGLSTYRANETDYTELASWYLQRYAGCNTLTIKTTMEAD